MSKLSIIIPTYNEVGSIGETIRKVKERSEGYLREIIVVDGGSADQSCQEAEKAGATVIQSLNKGRAPQMNYGAVQAKGRVLYFLHADTCPPQNFDSLILEAAKNGFKAGCFRLEFDDNHFLLKCYAWFSRFNIDLFRFGDQSLFIQRNLFFEIGQFREDHTVMEDQEFVRRVKRQSRFKIMDVPVVTSADKYRKNGIVRLQLIFTLILSLYYLGISQDTLTSVYKRFID